MATIAITGGTGMVGKALSRYLSSKGHQVIVLCRTLPQKKSPDTRYVLWDPNKLQIDADQLSGTDYIIHLAGANVAEKRWTSARKKEILESRTQSSALIVEYLRSNLNNVKAVISIAAIGWYGPDTGTAFTEELPSYHDFLGTTCKAWEESLLPVRSLGKRLVILRSGIVLSKEGGALKEFIKPLGFGIAPVLGSGDQMISWIHMTDLCRMFEWAMENEEIEGVFNAVAPHPVSNRELMMDLAKQLKGKLFLPVRIPSFFLKLLLGELSIEVLKSATVSSRKAESAGFEFMFPYLRPALSSLLSDAAQ